MRVGQETSAFLSTLNQRLSKIYPAMFEITGVMPEPIVDQARRLGRTEKMTCLNWKSDAAATVIRPLPKGNGPST
ncbi:MAG: hypothetical protein DMF34_07145 [Verrucomicrobia bacterium]|nr:MAG: hypothetical protein DMF34_07145 [Verrucomicrobiota bacterium]